MSRAFYRKGAQMKQTEILGIRFEANKESDVHSKIESSITENKTISIFTPNPDIIMKAQKDTEFKKILNSADILLPDGIGVILASKILSSPLPERITGIDMGEYILTLASKRGLKVFLLGGKQGVAELAAKKLRDRYNGLCICGTHHGYFDKNGKESKAVADYVSSQNPDIVFVCFGAPSQERWIYENKDLIPTSKIFIGLGGSLDVWSESVKRAPVIFRKLGLEWLWRVAHDLRKADRLFVIPSFFRSVWSSRV